MTLDLAYRVLLTYNILPQAQEEYYRYVIGEFVPTLQQLGLVMLFAWQVHGDTYAERQIEFVCESLPTLRTALNSDRFQQAEENLKIYTSAYSRKVVRFKNRFQF